MEKFKSQKEKIEPILGCSILYYPRDEFAQFLNFWEGIVSEDDLIPSGTFYKFVNYIQELYSMTSDEAHFTKERKINYIKTQIELETDEIAKNRFSLWFEDLLSKDDPSLFNLSEELFYRYCWECFKDKIELVDKKPIPFKDKIFVRPVIGAIKQDEVFSKLSDIDEQGGHVYPFNIKFLDNYIKPMTSQFVVIAGRPGGGKSTVLLRYMLNLAEQKIPSLYISLEMGKPQIRSRIASAISGRKIDKTDFAKQDEILRGPKFKEYDKYIDLIVNGSHDADVILRRMEQSVKDRGTKVILLDYMSLCKFVGKDEWQSLRELTSRLKRFAIENDVLVVSCSQASRDSENHGLMLSDLFGSSTIEADADIVIGIEQKESKGGFSDDGVRRGKLKILKNRDGELKDFNVEINYVKLDFNLID